MCDPYESDYLSFIITEFYPYINKLCVSYDRTELILVTATKLGLYIFIYYLLIQYIASKQNDLFENIFRYVSYIILFIIFLVIVSLFVVIVKTPSFYDPDNTKENPIIKSI